MSHDVKILVVDDHPKTLFATARIFKQANFIVYTASNGQEALDMVRSHLPDLVLLDVVLPDISGTEILHILKTDPKTSHIYIAMLSGVKAESNDQLAGLESGADEYITRPVSNRELLARVNALLRLKNTEKELEKNRNELEQLVTARTNELQVQIERRNQIYSELKDISELNRSIISQTTIGIGAYDESGQCVFANQSLARIIGADISQVMRQNYNNLDSWEKSGLIKAAQEVVSTGEKCKKVIQAISSFSKKVWLDITMSRVSKNDEFHLMILVDDITDRKILEKERDKNEATANALLNSTNESAFLLDQKGHLLYINTIGAERLGRRPEELVGKYIFDFVPPNLAKARLERFSESINSKKPIRFQDRRGEKYFDNNFYPIFDKRNRLVQVACFARDITEVMSAKEKYKRLVEDIAPLTFIYSQLPDGTITYITPSAKNILNLELDEILGRNWRELLNWEANSLKNAEFEVLKREQGADHNDFEVSFINNKGDLRTLHVVSHAIKNHDGIVTNIEGVVSEVTERRRKADQQEAMSLLLEQKVKERTHELESLNTALQILVKNREEDKAEVEKRIIESYDSLIIPLLEQLKKQQKSKSSIHIIEIIEENLKSISNGFSTKLSDPTKKLTSTELQIAALVKKGFSSKDIASNLSISPRTVTNHRNNIRKKLDLLNSKINLRSFLNAL